MHGPLWWYPQLHVHFGKYLNGVLVTVCIRWLASHVTSCRGAPGWLMMLEDLQMLLDDLGIQLYANTLEILMHFYNFANMYHTENHRETRFHKVLNVVRVHMY